MAKAARIPGYPKVIRRCCGSLTTIALALNLSKEGKSLVSLVHEGAQVKTPQHESQRYHWAWRVLLVHWRTLLVKGVAELFKVDLLGVGKEKYPT